MAADAPRSARCPGAARRDRRPTRYDRSERADAGVHPGRSHPAWTPPVAPAAPVTTPPATATTPAKVPAPPTPSADRRPLRWAAAIAVVTLVLGRRWPSQPSSPVGRPRLRSFATSRRTPSSTANCVSICPATSARRRPAFLSKFPGFADQAALETKLDETLDRLIGDASAGTSRPTPTDIKPWFDGELAFSVGPIPADALSGTTGGCRATGPVAALDQGPGGGEGLLRWPRGRQPGPDHRPRPTRASS